MKPSVLTKIMKVARNNPIGAIAVVALGALWVAGKAIDAISTLKSERRYS